MTTIKITIPRGDEPTTIHVASLLFDLWTDYQHYRSQAEQVDRQAQPLVYKRHVRAALLAFFSYFEGVLNSWTSKIDSKIDLENESIGRKLGVIRKRTGRRVPFLDVDRIRQIRNAVVHPSPAAEDVAMMEELLDGKFFHDADGFTKWLDSASRVLKLERHPDVGAVLRHVSKALGGN